MDSLSNITQQLQQIGFKKRKPVNNFKSGLLNLAQKEQARLPVIPWLYKNKPAVLTMAKPTQDTNTHIELRLWNSYTQILFGYAPLWVGTINYRTTKPKAMLHNTYKDVHYFFLNKPVLEELTPLLPKTQIKIIARYPDISKKTIKWSHNVVIIHAR